MPIDETKLLSAIEQEEQTAFGTDTDELSNDRAVIIDYYLGRPFGNEVEGRSQVVSRDVADTIEWVKPSLIRIFTTGDDIVKFDPQGPEDEEAAKQETDYVNYVVREKNEWFPIVYEWITDALMTRNAYCMAYWDDTKEYCTETYLGLSDDQMAFILQNPELEVLAHSEYPDPSVPPLNPAEQMLMPPQILHDVKIRQVKSNGRLKIQVLPPERCLVSERTRSMSVRESTFFEYWEHKTISELREMGLKVDDDISDAGLTEQGVVDIARDVGRITGVFDQTQAVDPSMRRVRTRMIWVRYDADQDGIAELLQCIVVGRTILSMVEVESIPVACIVPTMIPHRHIGLSMADAVMDLQLIKSTLLRGALDNMYLANNGRYGVSNKVNLDDMLTSRPGGIVRIDTNGADAGGHIMPFAHPVMLGQALQATEYFDSIRQARTGSSQAFTGVDPNSLGKSHSGYALAQLSSAAAQRVELVAMVISWGMRELFLIAHELIIKHHLKQEVVKLRNQWIPIDPRTWKTRKDMKISVGLGVGNKEQLMTNLRMILQMQGAGLQIGICTPENIYNTAAELTKAAGFSGPGKFWTDPAQQQPRPPQPDPAMVKAQTDLQKSREKNATDLQMHRETLQADTIQNAQNNATKLQVEHIKHAGGLIADARQAAQDLNHMRTEKAIDFVNDSIFKTLDQAQPQQPTQ